MDAVIDDDINQLAALVTDDVVAVHGNGQCSCGKTELKRDFEHALGRFDVARTLVSSEVIFCGHWAIEIDDVESTRAEVGSDDMPIIACFKAIFVFRRQSDAEWKVARVIELPA